MSVAPFGRLADGTPVDRVSLSGGGLAVQVLSLGAIIQDLCFGTGTGRQRCVLGFAQLDDYVAHSPYFGCVAGRYANRIADGRCVIDGTVHQLSRNEAGRTHLHGGTLGFGRRVWQIRDHGAGHVLLELISPDGEEGYPGSLTASCCYRITGDGELTIDLGASTDRATIVNLTTHS
ncbi:MAG: hypothetical protein JNL25_11090 [Rhodospirillaceae bacterium]|nr:hypothetical protein [Rhodospirillaceae bacterium]